jgi:hypothetical protein
MTTDEKPSFQKDGVQYRVNPAWYQPLFRFNKFLEKKRVYSDLRRSWRKFRNPFVKKDIELKKVNPEKINKMQVNCEEAKSFKYNFDKVPLHSTDKARFNPYYSSGLVKSGSWDIYTKEYRFDRVYRGIRDHFRNKIPWEETEYYNQYKLREETYQEKGYAKKEIEKTESLYKKMDEEGYQTRYDRGKLGTDDPPYLRKEQWPITVNIGRDGEYIFNNTGHNRLAISKILGFDEIPVLIVCRHKKWAEKEGIEYN